MFKSAIKKVMKSDGATNTDDVDAVEAEATDRNTRQNRKVTLNEYETIEVLSDNGSVAGSIKHNKKIQAGPIALPVRDSDSVKVFADSLSPREAVYKDPKTIFVRHTLDNRYILENNRSIVTRHQDDTYTIHDNKGVRRVIIEGERIIEVIEPKKSIGIRKQPVKTTYRKGEKQLEDEIKEYEIVEKVKEKEKVKEETPAGAYYIMPADYYGTTAYSYGLPQTGYYQVPTTPVAPGVVPVATTAMPTYSYPYAYPQPIPPIGTPYQPMYFNDEISLKLTEHLQQQQQQQKAPEKPTKPIIIVKKKKPQEPVPPAPQAQQVQSMQQQQPIQIQQQPVQLQPIQAPPSQHQPVQQQLQTIQAPPQQQIVIQQQQPAVQQQLQPIQAPPPPQPQKRLSTVNVQTQAVQPQPQAQTQKIIYTNIPSPQPSISIRPSIPSSQSVRPSAQSKQSLQQQPKFQPALKRKEYKTSKRKVTTNQEQQPVEVVQQPVEVQVVETQEIVPPEDDDMIQYERTRNTKRNSVVSKTLIDLKDEN